MSQKVSRKGSGTIEEKEKQADTPVKDMKKKVAANVEKDKHTEKTHDKTEKPKHTEKTTENKQRHPEKAAENKQKQPEKAAENKQKQPDKAADKEKPQEKSADKTDKKIEKNGVPDKKDDKEKKEDKPEKNGKADSKKAASKQNGSKHNGESNGVEEASDDDVIEIADDQFPELAYDDTTDNESPTPDSGAPSRSATRRSQVKATRTPETPLPASDKPAEPAATASAEQQTDSKILKMNEAPPTDRKLRSDDKDAKKDEDKKETEGKKDEGGKETGEGGDKDGDVIEIDDDEPRKTDTNYSKSRVKVSPYRRSTRIADQTTSSTTANYTGNNTTMEMDITASSSFAEEPTLDDSTYLNGLRSIRGRKSYKPLKELTLKQINRSVRSTTTISVSESSRPTGTVVGRKRKPEEEQTSPPSPPSELSTAAHTKRMRLLDRIAHPFRKTLAASPLPARRNPEIVGIITDLPLTAPVAPASLDPETLKPAPEVTLTVTPPTPEEGDKKRCIIM